MSGALQKTTFEELQNTLATVLKYIDNEMINAKDRCWKNPREFKSFLKKTESDSIKNAAKELNLGDTTVRDRWKILTLPYPVYSAIEENEISFSKAKPLSAINFDFEDEASVQLAQELVNEIKDGASLSDVKKSIEEKSSRVWNESNIVCLRIAQQHGIKLK